MSSAHTGRTPRSYSAREINIHFKDIAVPSDHQYRDAASREVATFFGWPFAKEDHSGTEQAEPNDGPSKQISLISRMTIFQRGAQPMYPPDIYTRSDPDVLHRNLGRQIPVYKQLEYPNSRYFRFTGYVKLVAIERIEANSDALKRFIGQKVKAGGLANERTREQWEEIFGTAWTKLSTRPVTNNELGDPMTSMEDVYGTLMADNFLEETNPNLIDFS